MTRKSKQILGLFQNFDSNPNMNQNRLVFRGALKEISLHVHKSLIFVYEGDFGINISLIRPNKVRSCSIWLGLFPNHKGGAS